MKNILFLFLVFSLLSCERVKLYTYIETTVSTSIYGHPEITTKEAVLITAPNDSIAYYKAYEQFCISQGVATLTKKSMSPDIQYCHTPLSFNLFTKDDVDISNFIFNDMEKNKKEIHDRIFSAVDAVVDNLDKTITNSQTKFESKELVRAKLICKTIMEYALQMGEKQINEQEYEIKVKPLHTELSSLRLVLSEIEIQEILVYHRKLTDEMKDKAYLRYIDKLNKLK